MESRIITDLKDSINNNIFHSHTDKLLRSHFFVIYLCFIFFAPSNSYADSKSILFISQEEKAFSSTLIEAIKSKLKNENSEIKIKTVSNRTTLSKDIVKSYDLIITLGSKPTENILKHEFNKPLLSLLITNRALDSLKIQKNEDQAWATLLLNQPIERQLLLAKHILGEKKTIGTLLGPYSSKHKETLIAASRKNNIKLKHETVQITDQLISSLKNLTRESDAILAIPDPVAFNKKTIRGILILTYRKSIPVIGFSKSYVKAGASASVYSTPEQISQNASELIIDFFKNNLIFKKEIYQPKYFSIAINKKITRTLGLKLENKKKIINLIKRDEAIK
jgi:putative tryptophan/tyrosine transport system substrate-binding protein